MMMLLAALSLLSLARSSQSAEQKQPPAGSVRHDFKLPEFFNFESFAKLFRKSYTSLVEQAERQQLFLARAFRSFASAVGYKHMRQSHYLAINSRSDWRPDELEASLMRNEDGLQEEDGGGVEIGNKHGSAGRSVEPPLVKANELERKLFEIEKRAQSSQAYSELADELRALAKRHKLTRRRRSSLSRADDDDEGLVSATPANERPKMRRGFDIEQASGPQARAAEQLHNAGARSRNRPGRSSSSSPPASNNPSYEPPELASMAGARTESEFRKHSQYKPVYYRWPISGTKRTDLLTAESNPTGGRGFLEGVLENFVGGLNDMFGSDDDANKPPKDVKHSAANQENQIFVDHRQSNCLAEVQDQGKCGSCYAFSAMAYLEWVHCMETKKLERFSVQYVVDCGQRAGGLRGCRSGKVTSMAEFVNNFGLELERNYPYLAAEQECPYEPSVDFDSMGYLRVKLGEVLRVPLEYMEHYLAESPMIVSLAVGDDFFEYGGGVDSGRSCGERSKHSMLLVGHGREEGREYWLIRNSHSSDWGEKGYYKLAKLTGSRCFVPREGFVYARDEHTKGTPRLFARQNSAQAKTLA